jgi:hypothetical protein
MPVKEHRSKQYGDASKAYKYIQSSFHRIPFMAFGQDNILGLYIQRNRYNPLTRYNTSFHAIFLQEFGGHHYHTFSCITTFRIRLILRWRQLYRSADPGEIDQ